MEIPGFDIKRVIGKGGMATAYLAIQQSPNRLVALKALSAGVSSDMPDDERANLVERFVNEGSIVSALRHPNIIEVYGIGESEDCLYIYMEYVGGGDLTGRIGKGMAPADALRIVSRIGHALGHAHGKGVIHRDVKPANILFRRDGTPLLTDFGIAKQLNLETEITAVGMLLGSPMYMSPEQAEGKSLDGRTDIYSLGVVLHEMLTGRPPYVATSPLQIILKHAQEPIPVLPRSLRRYQELLDLMLAKERGDRLPDARAMIEMADAVAAGAASAAAPDPASDEEPPPRRDDPTVETRVTHIITRVQVGILADLKADRLELPTLPEVVTRVRRVLDDPEATGNAIARAVSFDAALTAKVLRIANSALYAGQAPVADLRQAVVRLGGRGVEQIVTMLAVAQIYNLKASRSLKALLESVWHKSTRVAAICETIARRRDSFDSGVAMLGGLLHNIGAVPVLAWAERVPGLLDDEENIRQVMARVHVELGVAILDAWNFPAELSKMVGEHRYPERDGGREPDYTDVIVSAVALDAWSGPGDDELPSLPALGKLGLGPDAAETVLAEAATKQEELRALLGA